jgi:hypothetical protein
MRSPSVRQPHGVRVKWAVREARDTDIPVHLFPDQARWTACGHRLQRLRGQAGRSGRTEGGVIFAVTTDPLQASCHLCRGAIRKTLFSGAPEAPTSMHFSLVARRDPSRVPLSPGALSDGPNRGAVNRTP